jgi:hypothetical protein
MRRYGTLGSLVFAIAALGGYGTADGAPRITGIDIEPTHGATVTISGIEFGAKSPARPYLWAPFDGSAEPSSLGIVTSWTEVKNMNYAEGEGVSGSGALKASNSSGDWTARIDSSGFGWNDFGQQMYLFRKVKRNFNITDDLNWKIIRIWASGHTTPYWTAATNNGNLSVGGVNSGGWPYSNLSAARGAAGTWRTDEILTQSNTLRDRDDAKFFHLVNGRRVAQIPYTTYQTVNLRLNDGSGQMVIAYPVHGVKANTTLPSDYRYWVDDVYLDTTWARVVMANAPTLADATYVDIQIPTAWAEKQIQMVANTKAWPAGEPMYLFVVNEAGVASEGFPIGPDVLEAPSKVQLTGTSSN